jgi:SAM-dependent methyltransferase
MEPRRVATGALRRGSAALSGLQAAAAGRRRRRGHARARPGETPANPVERYWTGYTVASPRFRTARQSARHLEWRFGRYPLFRELTGLWGDHGGEVVLDFGCGPGNDVTGLLLYSGARRVVGADVSATALALARARLGLHRVDPARFELLQTTDHRPGLPLDDGSVDYAQSMGVLHHTTDPRANLRELHRVLRPGGRLCVMVYNRDSVWFHLYTAYEQLVLAGAPPGVGLEDAFRRSTDGEACPISIAYRAGDWIALCRECGFEGEYAGGYLSRLELERIDAAWSRALADERLDAEHRTFLRELTFDRAGLPMRDGFHAGIGGVYRLVKPG